MEMKKPEHVKIVSLLVKNVHRLQFVVNVIIQMVMPYTMKLVSNHAPNIIMITTEFVLSVLIPVTV